VNNAIKVNVFLFVKSQNVDKTKDVIKVFALLQLVEQKIAIKAKSVKKAFVFQILA